MIKTYNKPKTTISEQVEKLKSRGLNFHDETNAHKILKDISYYRLSGYFYHFQNENKNFVENIYFEDIIKLYGFDKKLRLLMLDGLETIEISIRSITGDVLGDIVNFAFDGDEIFNSKTDKIERFKNSREKNWERSRENFAEHFKEKYDSPPTWVAVETWTMGTLRDLFVCLKDKYLLQIAKQTSIKVDFLLLSWTKNLTTLRNFCAHHSRLWNRQLNTINANNKSLGELHTLFNDTLNAQKNDTNKNPNNRLYFYCMVIWYLLRDINPNSKWNKRLQELIKNEMPNMPSVALLNMGFPNDWDKKNFWGLKNIDPQIKEINQEIAKYCDELVIENG